MPPIVRMDGKNQTFDHVVSKNLTATDVRRHRVIATSARACACVASCVVRACARVFAAAGRRRLRYRVPPVIRSARVAFVFLLFDRQSFIYVCLVYVYCGVCVCVYVFRVRVLL